MPIRSLCALILAAFTGSAAAEAWTRTSEVGATPVEKTLRRQLDLDANGRVDVRQIGGSVEVKAGDGNTVELVYERRARTQKDFDCETLEVDHSRSELRIRTEHRRDKACRMIYADDRLTLTVPRGASVAVRDVGAEVHVTGVTGLVRLSDIGDSVTVRDAQQVEVSDVGDAVRLDVNRVGPAGIRIHDIGDSVELTLPEAVDARMRIGNVGDEIRGPGLRLESDDEDDENDFETVLGQGGPMIKIEDVGDSVVIRGPRLSKRAEL